VSAAAAAASAAAPDPAPAPATQGGGVTPTTPVSDAAPVAPPAGTGSGSSGQDAGARQDGDRADAQPAPATLAAPAPFGAPTGVTAPVPAVVAPAAQTAPRYTVGLGDAVETVRLTMAASVRDGFSAARISLAPAELGGVRIDLAQTSDGLVARVVAEHPAAAQVLAQSAGELRSTLAALGVTVAQLDIGTSADPSGAGTGESAPGGQGGARSDQSSDGDAAGTPEAPGATTVQLANGVLIDVLA
jgi:flagellar hook-length control protein FliK